MNSSLRLAGDNTNEFQLVYGPIFLKYENKESTRESSIQAGLNLSLKAGLGIILDATFIEAGVKVKLPR